jgi:hypothetical protein
MEPTRLEPIKKLTAAVLPVTIFEVATNDGVKHYELVLDFNAICKAQDAIGRDLSNPLNWQDLSASDLSAICWAAFDRNHPEVTLREVRSWLAPAQKAELFVMLIEQCYPGILERVGIELEKKEKSNGAANGHAGEPEPNLRPE